MWQQPLNVGRVFLARLRYRRRRSIYVVCDQLLSALTIQSIKLLGIVAGKPDRSIGWRWITDGGDLLKNLELASSESAPPE